MAGRNFTRREFMGSVGLGTAGSLLVSHSANARTKERIELAKGSSDRPMDYTTNAKRGRHIEFAKGPSDHPMDVQIAVKPVAIPLIHSDLWEGPCRARAGEGPEQERAGARMGLKMFAETLQQNMSKDMKLLDPAYVEYSEDFWIRPDELAKLEPDSERTDVYALLPTGMPNYTANVIAETFRKPVIVPGGHFVAADAVSSLNAMGLEGHTVFDLQDFGLLISLLKTRKVFQQTRILVVTDRDLPPIPVRSCMDVDMLQEKFGIGSHFVSYHEFANEMDKVLADKELSVKADDMAKKLIKNAEETHIDKKYVKRSVEFYYAVRNLMKKYSCNAFTVECFELCASRLAEKYKITPCLVHTLLKDQGIASACEADINALLSMRLLMSVANKSSFMGNPVALLEDQLYMNHSVPGIKMAGYDKSDLPYHLRHFVESGWGTKVMIDFMEHNEKTVTLARIDQFGTKIYLAKGEVVECSGYKKGMASESLKRANLPQRQRNNMLEREASLIGCSLAAHINVPDARESMRKFFEFGSHLSMVYGDYTREITELADMMGLEVVYGT